jgi:hypothetical protein
VQAASRDGLVAEDDRMKIAAEASKKASIACGGWK